VCVRERARARARERVSESVCVRESEREREREFLPSHLVLCFAQPLSLKPCSLKPDLNPRAQTLEPEPYSLNVH
jgi:hypothetical protein